MLSVYGDSISGNCLKVKWTLDRLGVAYAWEEVEVLSGRTRTPEFLAINPAGQVPVVLFGDGRSLAQSNAIILHFAEGTDLIPEDAFAAPGCSNGCSGSSTATSPTSRCAASSCIT